MDDTVAVKAMASWIVTAREAARSPVVRAELRREAKGLLRNGEYDAARRIFEDILQESAPALPSFRGGTPEQICRTDQGMYLRFAEHPYETSWEFASGFIVDYSPDAEIIGLEILLSEQKQTDLVEAPLLAFGVFGAALFWFRYHHRDAAGKFGGRHASAVSSQIRQLIGKAALNLKTVNDLGTRLAIHDDSRKCLLVADFKRVRTKPPWPGMSQFGAIKRGSKSIAASIDLVRRDAADSNSDAIGIAVLIDETGQARRNPRVPPGRWTDWPGAGLYGNHIRAHIAIIPPQNSAYPWLPRHFLDFPA